MTGRDLIISGFALALLAYSTPAQSVEATTPERWLPDRQLIERLERQTKMPEGSAAIENTVRYYTGWRSAVSGHRLVYGTIIARDLPLFGSNRPAPTIRIVEPNAMPDFLARNCGIVMLVFIGTNQFAAHPWLGACYEAHLEARGQLGTRMPVRVKHIPFADSSSTTHSG